MTKRFVQRQLHVFLLYTLSRVRKVHDTLRSCRW